MTALAFLFSLLTAALGGSPTYDVVGGGPVQHASSPHGGAGIPPGDVVGGGPVVKSGSH